MRTHTAALFGVLFVAAPIVVIACKKDDAAPAPTTPAGYPSGSAAYGAYGQQPAQGYPPGTYPQQGAYPQQPAAGYPQQPGAAPGAYPQQPGAAPGAPAAPGQMAVPGPAALPCSNDSMCMTHKCNTQYGKCAFPCESDSDCITGAYCFKSAISTCLPKPPGQ
jgi:hypothetical protein